MRSSIINMRFAKTSCGANRRRCYSGGNKSVTAPRLLLETNGDTWPGHRTCSAIRALSRRIACASSSSGETCSSRLSRFGIDGNGIAFAHERNRATHGRFRRDVPDDQTVRGARKAAVGDQADRIAQSGANQRGGRSEHLAHARTALRAFVANHDHIARMYLLREDRREAVLFGIEDARRPGDLFGFGNLCHRAFGARGCLSE